MSQGSTTPGAPVTAVLAPDGIITLFLADTGGVVWTASGNPLQGWGGGWTPVSPQSGVRTTPGAPVTAVLAPDGIVTDITLFLADTGGIVYTASSNPVQGWGGGWTPVSPQTGTTTAGAPVTAVLGTDGTYTLFMANTAGEVFNASGDPVQGWGPWFSVPQGSTTPGAPVTAVLGTDGIITLFLADPGGGVYTTWGNPAEGGLGTLVQRVAGQHHSRRARHRRAGPGRDHHVVPGRSRRQRVDRRGNRAEGCGPWTPVSPQTGTATPGAPVTAVLGTDGTYTLFLADPGGEVFTASGKAQGWGGGWTPVSPQTGTTTPGAPVTAVLATDGTYTLFMANASGEVFTASGKAQGWGAGWTPVSPQTGTTTPGATVTAVPGTDGTYTLFMADTGGEVFTASGNAQAWGAGWTTVSQGSTTGGAPVTAVLGTDGIITLFLADPGGGVYTAWGNRTEGYGRLDHRVAGQHHRRRARHRRSGHGRDHHVVPGRSRRRRVHRIGEPHRRLWTLEHRVAGQHRPRRARHRRAGHGRDHHVVPGGSRRRRLRRIG